MIISNFDFVSIRLDILNFHFNMTISVKLFLMSLNVKFIEANEVIGALQSPKR